MISGCGTQNIRLSQEAIKDSDCCCLSATLPRPTITAGGFLFGRQAILEYIFHQRKKETSLREAARSSAGGAQTAAVAVAQDQVRGFLEEEAASVSRPFTSTAASGNGPDDA